MSPARRRGAEVVARQVRLDAVLRTLRPRVRRCSRGQAARAVCLWRVLDLFAPQEVDLAVAPIVSALAAVGWARAPDRFRGPDLHALVSHLLVTVLYPLPELVWRDLARGDPAAVGLLAFLGRGGSVRDAGRAGLLPRLTPRQGAVWWHADGATSVRSARAVQAAAAGCPPELSDTLLGTFLGELQPDEARWQAVVAWVGAHAAEIDAELVVHLLDYLRAHPHEPGARAPWTVLRAALAWGASTCVDGVPARRRFPPSGVRGGPLEGGWSVHELPNALALIVEGRVLHHCVATYTSRADRGRCALFGLRLAGRRLLTVEVRPEQRAIVQVRGDHDRPATPEEWVVLRAWARREGLDVHDG